MLSEREQSLSAAERLERTLGFASGLAAGAALMGAWAAAQFRLSVPLITFVVLASAWATVCYHARSLILGRILRIDFPSVLYISVSLLTSGKWLIMAGVLMGVSLHLTILTWVAGKPKLKLMDGDRLYSLEYPLARFFPIAYLAPEPLSTLFDPLPIAYYARGPFGLPVWKLMLIEPLALHNYLVSRAAPLTSRDPDWEAMIGRYRRAMLYLSILEVLGKHEESSLDWAALAASARLAIYSLPETAKLTLIEALISLEPDRRNVILQAFDLLPSRAG